MRWASPPPRSRPSALHRARHQLPWLAILLGASSLLVLLLVTHGEPPGTADLTTASAVGAPGSAAAVQPSTGGAAAAVPAPTAVTVAAPPTTPAPSTSAPS